MTGAADAALITRPRDEAVALAALLAERGYRPLIEPLLDIRFTDGAPLSRQGLQGLLLTSANGARALVHRLGAELAAWCDLPVWAVGESSAKVARELGFTRVESADGDVTRLASLVIARADPAAGTLLQAAASELAGDLQGELTAKGFRISREVLYEAVPAGRLSAHSRAELLEGRVALALFFSPRSAASFVALSDGAVASACAGVTALALSAAVAEKLAALPWRSIGVAAEPKLQAMLAWLDGVR